MSTQLRLCAWHGHAVEVPLRAVKAAIDHLGSALPNIPHLLALSGFKVESRGEPHYTAALESGMALFMEAMPPSTGLGLMLWFLEFGCWAVQMAVGALHQGKVFWIHGPLMFLVGVGLMDVGEQYVLVGEDLRAVDTLQVDLLRSWVWWVSMCFSKQLVLAEGVLVDHLHPQVASSVPGERHR